MSPLRPPEAAGKGGAARTAHARTPLPALRPLRSPPALPRSWTLPLHSLCIWNVPLHAQGGQSPLSPFLFPLFSLSSLTPRSSRGLINLLKKARFSLTAFQRRNVRGIFFFDPPSPPRYSREWSAPPPQCPARGAPLSFCPAEAERSGAEREGSALPVSAARSGTSSALRALPAVPSSLAASGGGGGVGVRGWEGLPSLFFRGSEV